MGHRNISSGNILYKRRSKDNPKKQKNSTKDDLRRRTVSEKQQTMRAGAAERRPTRPFTDNPYIRKGLSTRLIKEKKGLIQTETTINKQKKTFHDEPGRATGRLLSRGVRAEANPTSNISHFLAQQDSRYKGRSRLDPPVTVRENTLDKRNT